MNHRRILDKTFFCHDTRVVALELLGKFLVRRIGKKEISLMITETEAYDGPNDKASHAYKGKTKRNEVMFDESGLWYVYLVYGMYNMLNIVTGAKEYPAAVLIRGVERVNGPGKVTKFLKITKSFNKKKSSRESGLWIEDRGIVVHNKEIKKTPRIGVAYAGKWAKKPYRFVYKNIL